MTKSSGKRLQGHLLGPTAVAILLLTFLCSIAFSEDPKPEAKNDSFRIAVTHVLGLPDTPPNTSGSLVLDGETLQFTNKKQQTSALRTTSIETILLSQQDKQVGGVPMTLGKAAVPFGGGRVVSLFSHKKYDDIAVVYRDDNGAVHGAIFQLAAGQGKNLRDKLVSSGARVGPRQDAATVLPTPEVVNASK